MSRPTVRPASRSRIRLLAALRAAAGLAVLCVLSQAVAAQTLEKGARVRVVQDGAQGAAVLTVEGKLVGLRGDTALIEPRDFPGHVQHFALGVARRLEVAGPSRYHVGRRVAKGLLIGGLGLGALAAASFTPCHSDQFMGCLLAPTSRLEAGMYGFAAGAVVGTLVGLVVGVVTRDATWVPARTSGIQVALAPGGVGLRIAF